MKYFFVILVLLLGLLFLLQREDVESECRHLANTPGFTPEYAARVYSTCMYTENLR